jgi:hypothetical protein
LPGIPVPVGLEWLQGSIFFQGPQYPITVEYPLRAITNSAFSISLLFPQTADD